MTQGVLEEEARGPACSGLGLQGSRARRKAYTVALEEEARGPAFLE